MRDVLGCMLLCITGFALPASAAEDHSGHRMPDTSQVPPDQSDVEDHGAHSGQDAAVDDAGSRTGSAHESHLRHSVSASEPTESERAHVAPDPPRHPLEAMSEERMIELMQMEDNGTYSKIILDQLEWRPADNEDVVSWEFDAWYGTDYNKIWFETEGERSSADESGRVEIMWDRIISPWWSFQTGIRRDFGNGPERTWADFGFQGLAPYFIEVDVALYVAEEGRTAVRFSSEYDLRLTQRLILQPEFELDAYGKTDAENGIGSGLSEVELGLRLRYELQRELTPYVGVHWERKFGRTSDLARENGEEVSDFTVIAGIRAWF